MQNKDRKHVWAYDYSGYWTGKEKWSNGGIKTMSVGIFQWVPRVDGERVKKSAVVHRVIGPLSKTKEIIAKAERVCDLLNAGVILKHKTTTVKGRNDND